MRRLIITGILGASLVGCDAGRADSKPCGIVILRGRAQCSRHANAPDATTTGDDGTEAFLPTLTLSSAGAAPGAWPTGSRSARAAPGAMPVLAGEHGVLLLSATTGGNDGSVRDPGPRSARHAGVFL